MRNIGLHSPQNEDRQHTTKGSTRIKLEMVVDLLLHYLKI